MDREDFDCKSELSRGREEYEFDENISESVRSANVQRYSRSNLLLIRNDTRSRQRPECVNRSDLQLLGFWKISAGVPQNNATVNNNNSSVSTVLETPLSSNPNGPMNSRALRNRERLVNYYRRMNSEDDSSTGVGGGTGTLRSSSPLTSMTHIQQGSSSSVQKPYIDHRSISSAHLMPAFAKRRITISSVASPFEQRDKSSNGCKDSSFESNERGHQTTTPLGKDLKHDFQHQQDDDVLSVQRNPLQEQKDHVHNPRHLTSPIAVGMRHGNIMSTERRIGSGRLLPRDGNWDYRNQDKDKSSQIAEKDQPSSHSQTSHHLAGGQKSNALRYGGDRSHDRSEIYGERRSYDRRTSGHGVGIDDSARDKYDIYKAGNTQQQNTSRVSKKDMFNSSDTVGNHHQSNHGRRRHHHMNDRNEEPEWFSGGPTSQHETIELHGFDDLVDSDSDNSKSVNMKGKELQRKRNHKDPKQKQADLNETAKGKNIDSTTVHKDQRKDDALSSKSNTQNIKIASSVVGGVLFKNNDKESDFNFDAFLNLDPLDNSLMHSDTSVSNDSAVIGCSRFSRWFPNKASGEGSAAAENRNEIESSDEHKNMVQNVTLMEFLQRGKLPSNQITDSTKQVAEMPSVEELEARMRNLDSNNDTSKMKPTASGNMNSADIHMKKNMASSDCLKPPSSVAQDTVAFKKLLEQLGSGNNALTTSAVVMQQQHLLHEMFSHSNKHQNSAQGSGAHVMHADDISKNDEMKKMMQCQQMQMHQQHQTLQQQQQKQMQMSFPVPPYPLQHHQLPPLSPQHDGILPHLFTTVPSQKRMEVQHLLKCLVRGEISVGFLELELSNPNTSTYSKDIIATALHEHHNKHQIMQPTLVGVTTPQTNQRRLSNPNIILTPGPAAEHRTSNQLVFQGEGQSNVEVAIQNSLLKKKLGEQQQQQQDVLRRRQEIQQKQKQQHLSNISMQQSCLQQQQSHTLLGLQLPRHNNSPTPLAFTPTSVLRKMTADKECTTNSAQQQTVGSVVGSQQLHPIIQNKSNTQISLMNQQNQPASSSSAPRMILGGNHSLHQHQLRNPSPQISPQPLSQHSQQQIRNNQHPIKWPAHMVSSNVPLPNKPMGRPILKGPVNSMPAQPPLQHMSQMTMASKIEFQQIQQHQHRLKQNQTPQNVMNQLHPPQLQQQTPTTTNVQNFSHGMQTQPSTIMTHLQQQQLFQHQHRTMAMRQQQQQLQLQQMNQQQHMDAQNRTVIGGGGVTAIIEKEHNNNQSGSGVIINYQRDGGLSPTSNQLAQWFSPELLAQASAGKLPLLNMNQALSLEEFERSIQHSSTAVHN